MKTQVKHTTKILRLNHTDGGNESMAAKVPMGGLNTEPPQAPTNWRGITKELVVSVSAKHIHLTQGDVEILFGKGYELKPKAFLSSMPEQVGLHVGFASTDTVTIIGNKPSLKSATHAYGTNIEGEMDVVLKVLQDCHMSLHNEHGVPRVSTTVKIGTRNDKFATLEDKINTVNKELGR